MSKEYILRFGSLNPGSYAGLNPTFTSFVSVLAGTSALPPGISRVIGATGLYYFTYGPTNAVSFIVDGVAGSLSATERYIVGVLDPVQAVDQQLSQLGSTMQAIGNTTNSLIGSTLSSYGSDTVDPATLFGYAKRLQELGEGNANFNKSTGNWEILSRGSSTLLRDKTLSNSTTTVQKT